MHSVVVVASARFDVVAIQVVLVPTASKRETTIVHS